MEAYMSMITPYGCNFTIQSWGACAGGLLSVNQMQALYSLLGTQFGGDGANSFGLPDLRGRSPVSRGNGIGLNPVMMGQMGGQESTTLSTLNMPAHDHIVSLSGTTAAATASLQVSNDAAGTNTPDGNFLGAAGPTTRIYSDTLSNPAGTQAAAVIPSRNASFAGNTMNSGGSIPFQTQSPYQGVNYQICMYGLYPSRN